MRFSDWTIVLLSLLVAGCASQPVTRQETAAPRDIPGGDVRTTARCAETMEGCLELILQLRSRTDPERDYFLPREQDVLEWSLAEYLAARKQLHDLAQSASSDPEQQRACQQLRAERDTQLAALAVEDPVLWKALNQSFHRSGIPRGSCDQILHEVTASSTEPLASDTQQRVDDLVRRRSLLLPTVENELRHSTPTQLLAASGRAVSTQLHRGHYAVVAGTNRLRNPVVRPLTFSEEQIRQIRSSLRPGDVLLTYAAGYASNLFVPGNFKHAATFVGTDAERRRNDLTPERLLASASPNNQLLADVLERKTIETGQAADIVESVADGVVLNNFEKLLTTRINRLVVLRPRLTHAERAEQLADVLSYVGDEYDFSFDLTDASDQVCTEVVYRSLHGRGGIDPPLSQHAGQRTLLADDLLRYYLKHGDQFACVLAIDESPQAAGTARVLRGSEAKGWIATLPGVAE